MEVPEQGIYDLKFKQNRSSTYYWGFRNLRLKLKTPDNANLNENDSLFSSHSYSRQIFIAVKIEVKNGLDPFI
jgi:hypothetical protein